jgi:hypothetical protein
MSDYPESRYSYVETGIDVLFTDNIHLLQKIAIGFCERFADLLQEGETVLYLNCSTSDWQLARAFEPVRRRKGGRWFRSQTFRSGDIAKSTSMLETALKSYNTRLLVINCLEFAAISAHHKARFIPWLRTVRDYYDCHVLLLMTRKLAPYGPERMLSLWANEVAEVEKENRKRPPSSDVLTTQTEPEENGPDAGASAEPQPGVPETEEELTSPAAPNERTVIFYDECLGSMRRETIPVEPLPEKKANTKTQSRSLKTNDLQSENVNRHWSGGLEIKDLKTFLTGECDCDYCTASRASKSSAEAESVDQG